MLVNGPAPPCSSAGSQCYLPSHRGGLHDYRSTKIHGRDPTAHHHDIFIARLMNRLRDDIDRLPGTSLPAERPGEHPGAQVQYPFIMQQPPSVELQALLTND